MQDTQNPDQFAGPSEEIYIDTNPASDKILCYPSQKDADAKINGRLVSRQQAEGARVAAMKAEVQSRPEFSMNGFSQAKEQTHKKEEESAGRSQDRQETGNDRSKSGRAASHLAILLAQELEVGKAATKSIVYRPPLITRNEVGIIGRSTVNVIQGAYGSHKSRLAETIAALMLMTNSTNDQDFIGFMRTTLERFCVCYIDTERNLIEELPHAIQNIKLKAGYKIDDHPAEFRFTSIKSVPRNDRFPAIEGFIRHVREQTLLHLFIIIDVATDAIGDFNDPKESMRLFDFLGNICDQHDATFLLVIHQNPGTEKARGHAGTEAANKASTVLQIGLEKDANGNDTELIKLRYLKLRRGKRPEPLYLQFNSKTNGLALADTELLNAHVNQRKRKSDIEDMAERLVTLLSDGAMQKGDVWATLEKEFKAGNRTVRDNLKSIVEQTPQMYDEQGKAVRLADYKEGRNQFYHLVPCTS